MFVQSIERAREERIGREGVSDQALAEALARLEPALEKLRSQHADGSLPLLRMPTETGDLASITQAVTRLMAGATDIVMLGTGGSSLGAQALCAVAGVGIAGVGAFRPGPRLHFLDNLDPLSFEAFLAAVPLETTTFLAVSKSGGTGETLMQVIAVIEAMKQAGLGAKIAERMVGLSEPTKAGKLNGLRRLLESFGVPMLEHHTGIGGRYSALTNVGLLPAALAGLDIAAIRAGAAEVLAPVLAGKPAAEVPAAVGAALAMTAAEEGGKTVAPIMVYADRLGRFGAWYVQLWAESIGKQGRGTTPVLAVGPVDQHSQLQLFIDGPRDKLFTVITTDCGGTGPLIEPGLSALAGEPGFGGRRIGDLVAAQGRATADTLARNGCPVRTIEVGKVDARTMGGLMMHFFLETILAAHLLGVDPFDQPAVEEGKILAKKYLAESA